MNKIETQPNLQEIGPLLNAKDIQEFIKDREINLSYVELLEKLYRFPQKFFIEFHNFLT